MELKMSGINLVWDDEALKKLEKIPFFARKIARKKIEQGAIGLGEERITPELMEKIRSQVMDNR